MLSYAKSVTARPGDRLNGFENGKTKPFNSWELENEPILKKKWSVPIKVSYDAISRFAFSMECYKLIVHRQDLKSQNHRDILYQS